MSPRLRLVRNYAPTSDSLYLFASDADSWATKVADRKLQPLIHVVDDVPSIAVSATDPPPPTTGG